MELAEEYRKRKRVPPSEEVTNSEEKRLRLDNERNWWSPRRESHEKEPVNRSNQGYVQLPPTSQIHYTTDISNNNYSILDKPSVLQEHEDDFVPWDFPETLSIPDIILDQNVAVDDQCNTETATSMSWNSIPSESLLNSTDVPHTSVSGIPTAATCGTHTLSSKSGFATFPRIPSSQTPQWEIPFRSDQLQCQHSLPVDDRTFDPTAIGKLPNQLWTPARYPFFSNKLKSFRFTHFNTSHYEKQYSI